MGQDKETVVPQPHPNFPQVSGASPIQEQYVLDPPGGGGGAGDLATVLALGNDGAALGIVNPGQIASLPDGGGSTAAQLTLEDATATDGGLIYASGGDSPLGNTGGSFTTSPGSDDDQRGGPVFLGGGNGIADSEGGSITLQAGDGNNAAKAGAQILVQGGGSLDGRVSIITNASTGAPTEVLTAQGDGTAVWAPGGGGGGVTNPLSANLETAGFVVGTLVDGSGVNLFLVAAGDGDLNGGGVTLTPGTAGVGGGGVDMEGGVAAAGLGTLGFGGAVVALGGDAVVPAGGAVLIDGGDAGALTNGNGGDLTLSPGAKDGAGTDGKLSITDSAQSTGAMGEVLTAQGDTTALWQAGGGAPTLAAVLTVSDDAGASPITNLTDPTNPQDAATKAYVDSFVVPVGITGELAAQDLDGTSDAGAVGHYADVGHQHPILPTVRFAAGVPAGAPSGTELPIAFDSTAVTGGVYYWSGAAWVKGGTI